MWGCTAPDYADEQDLLLLVVVYRSAIFASSSYDNSSDSPQCGGISEPCISLNVALPHTIPSVYSNFLNNKSAVVSGEASTHDVTIKSLDAEDSQLQKVQFRNAESKASLIVLSSDGSGGHSNIQYNHSEFDTISVLSGSLLSVECQDSDIQMKFLAISNTVLGDGCAMSVISNVSTFHFKQSSFLNLTRDWLGPCCLDASSSSLLLDLENCSNKKCTSRSKKGSIAALADLADGCMSSCVFDGATSEPELRASDDRSEELCQWIGSMVDLQN
ncbi:uncharacterized protein MONOS_13222 [Monocercomonoides exilis]|uniref:uncharacterized protein n=1 Tax=Monocercomonoides exilis TaxID=2049356 RepID=UPI00355A07BA|nr:hypothetical protein MONOS_13222 [Monocercomonoides exilis]|eukprot:MONOS_13222.1-p1 / transcript=MONOS_13222.1 / gene=MONOS_13222 / organism=Monocercomonoides_exilis_PA203 / gene_product=unspecified product / transcript_product=unspecified product / location=Mono_scaffold00793:22405-23696(+) / protein_length=273 / sequence_SO=supercontig / SO=protein_coding / is_pseudo=false